MTPAAQPLLALPEGDAEGLARLKGQTATKPVLKFSFKEEVRIKLCFNTNVSL